MKLKAAVTRNPILDSLVAFLNSAEFCGELLEDALGKCLHVENVLARPGEHYVQECDRTVELLRGCFGVEVRLTGASVTPERTDGDFHDALQVIFGLYATTIEEYAPDGERVQLFVAIMTNDKIRDLDGFTTTVLESRSDWVEGTKAPWYD